MKRITDSVLYKDKRVANARLALKRNCPQFADVVAYEKHVGYVLIEVQHRSPRDNSPYPTTDKYIVFDNDLMNVYGEEEIGRRKDDEAKRRLKAVLGDDGQLYEIALDALKGANGSESALYGRLSDYFGQPTRESIRLQWDLIERYSNPMGPCDYIQALDRLFDEMKPLLKEDFANVR